MRTYSLLCETCGDILQDGTPGTPGTIAIIRITGIQQKSTALIYNNLKEARKYFSYILQDNHSYTTGHAQESASTLEISDTFTVNDSTYWLSEIVDTRNL